MTEGCTGEGESTIWRTVCSMAESASYTLVAILVFFFMGPRIMIRPRVEGGAVSFVGQRWAVLSIWIWVVIGWDFDLQTEEMPSQCRVGMSDKIVHTISVKSD